jgi:hypothetical protein
MLSAYFWEILLSDSSFVMGDAMMTFKGVLKITFQA